MKLDELLANRAQNRPVVAVKLSDFLSDAPDGDLVVRVLTASEESDATKCATEYRRGLIAQLAEKFAKEFLADFSFIEDARDVERLWRACRRADDHGQPAFPSAEWMRQSFTRGELRDLHGFYEKALAKSSRGAGAPLDRDVVLYFAQSATVDREQFGETMMKLSKPRVIEIAAELAALAVESQHAT